LPSFPEKPLPDPSADPTGGEVPSRKLAAFGVFDHEESAELPRTEATGLVPRSACGSTTPDLSFRRLSELRGTHVSSMKGLSNSMLQDGRLILEVYCSARAETH